MDIVGPKCGPRVGLDPAPRDTGHRRARGLQVAIPNLPERHASNLRVSLSSSGNGALHQLIGRAGFDHAPKPSSGACCRGCALMAADPVAGTLQEGLGVGLGPEGEGDACSLDPQGELSGWLVESRGTQAATDCVEPRCDSSVGEGPGELGECRRSRAGSSTASRQDCSLISVMRRQRQTQSSTSPWENRWGQRRRLLTRPISHGGPSGAAISWRVAPQCSGPMAAVEPNSARIRRAVTRWSVPLLRQRPARGVECGSRRVTVEGHSHSLLAGTRTVAS